MHDTWSLIYPSMSNSISFFLISLIKKKTGWAKDEESSKSAVQRLIRKATSPKKPEKTLKYFLVFEKKNQQRNNNKKTSATNVSAWRCAFPRCARIFMWIHTYPEITLDMSSSPICGNFGIDVPYIKYIQCGNQGLPFVSEPGNTMVGNTWIPKQKCLDICNPNRIIFQTLSYIRTRHLFGEHYSQPSNVHTNTLAALRLYLQGQILLTTGYSPLAARKIRGWAKRLKIGG